MVSIIGWAHTKFGKLEEEDIESLITRVSKDAIADAGIEPHEVGAIYVGNCGGFDPQTFPASFALNASDDMRFKRSTRVENACATGSAALHQGMNEIEAKKARFVLVVGAEKMTNTPSSELAEKLLSAAYLKEEGDIAGGFAGVFGVIANSYFQKYGDQSTAMAQIAAKNHKNGVDNPYSQMRKDLGFDFCNTVSEKNPYVAGPIRRTDCSLVSDGAAAVVLCDDETAREREKAIHFRAAVHVQDFLPMSRREIIDFEGCSEAWKRAHEVAGTTLDDLSLVEVHDCFTIAELIVYEAMGLAPKGQGARVIADGISAKDGKLPVNPSGGLKSKGHPIGATGVSMHVMNSMQLMGEAEDMQIKDAELTGVFNMGGACVANYVSILERLR